MAEAILRGRCSDGGTRTSFNPPPDPRPAETTAAEPTFRRRSFNPPPDPRPAETPVPEIAVEPAQITGTFQSAAGPASGGNREPPRRCVAVQHLLFQSAAGPASGGNTTFSAAMLETWFPADGFNPPPDRMSGGNVESLGMPPADGYKDHMFQSAAGPASGGKRSVKEFAEPSFFAQSADLRPAETFGFGSLPLSVEFQAIRN